MLAHLSPRPLQRIPQLAVLLPRPRQHTLVCAYQAVGLERAIAPEAHRPRRDERSVEVEVVEQAIQREALCPVLYRLDVVMRRLGEVMRRG